MNDLQLSKTSFPVENLLREVVDQFQGLTEERSAVLHVHSPGITVTADRSRLLQILINLVGNALKFSKASDIVLRAGPTEAGLCFEVADNGIGIAPQDLDRIFHAFTQVEAAENRAEGGTGLGLAICKKLALAHGGDITVKSKLGAGTVFTVLLPGAVDTQAAPAVAAVA